MILLVLGGARSGKSAFAEQAVERLAGGGPVTYVATWTPDPDDQDMARRVDAHRARRPDSWSTVEAGAELGAALAAADGVALVDSLTTWLAADPDLSPDVDGLLTALVARSRRGDGSTVIVSDEVGFGVHPSTELGRRFRDALGELNQAVADTSDTVVLVVAGRALELGPAEDVLRSLSPS